VGAVTGRGRAGHPLESDARREAREEVREAVANLGTLQSQLGQAALDAAFGELKDRRRDLLISGLGMLALAAACAVLAWWLLSGAFSQGRPPALSPSRDGEPITNNPLRALTYAGVASCGLGAIFALFGAISTVRAVVGRRA
jgi:hypothetical protein